MALTASQKEEMRNALSTGGNKSNTSTQFTKDQKREMLSKLSSQGALPSSDGYKLAISNEFSKNIGQGSAFGAGGLKGLLDFASGANVLESKLVDKLLGTNLAGKAPKVELPQSMQQSIQQFPTAAKTGEFLGSAAPMFALPGGAFGEAASLAPAISKLPSALQGIAKLGGKLGKGAAVGAATAPIYSPEEDLKSSMKSGAELGMAGPLAEKLVGAGLSSTKNMHEKIIKGFLGGTHSPKEIERNISALKTLGLEDKMPIGEVINSPHMKTLSGLSASIPGSGQAKNFINIGQSIKKTVSDVLNDIKPGKSENVAESLIKDVSKGRSHELKISNEKHKKLEDIASKTGSNVFKKSLDSASDDVNKLIKNDSVFKKYSNDADIQSILDNVNKKTTSVISGTRVKQDMSFKEALDLRRKINDSLKNTPFEDRRKKSMLMKFKNALDKDLSSSAKASKNDDVINALQDANKHYKENVVPVNKRDIVKFTDLGEDSDKFIPSFLKTGQYSRDNLLNNVSKHLSDKNKGKLGYEYLTRKVKEVGGEEQIEEGKILNEYMKLSNNTKKQLFTKDQRNKFDSAHMVKKMAGGDLYQMMNPKTGEMWKKALLMLSSALVVPPVAANIATKMMKNPKLKEQYLQFLESKGMSKSSPNVSKLSELSKFTIPAGMNSKKGSGEIK